MHHNFPEGRAVVYCEEGFANTNGKTAHGLVRKGRRYEVLAVIDSTLAGKDAGEVLDSRHRNIPIVENLDAALQLGSLKYFVIGLAPDGGKLEGHTRSAVKSAIMAGLNVDSGLHDYLTDDAELVELAKKHGVQLRDIRKPPAKDQLHFFSGCINEVTAYRIAVLGTDSAVGKRTTAWTLVDGLNARGVPTELIGTGQTAWLQGARFGIRMDSLVNDFVAGELEYATWSAWNETKCQALVIEGQGSLMHPAYPGGFEILAACQPHAVVMQHAPARKEYDGFPGYPVAALAKQIQAVELIGNCRVVGITINHEGMNATDIESTCKSIASTTGLPVCDVLVHGSDPIVGALLQHRNAR